MTQCSLADRTCEPCKGGVPPLTESEQAPLLAALNNGWAVVEGHHLHRHFPFGDFAAALAFTNQIGALAERHSRDSDTSLVGSSKKFVVVGGTHGTVGEHDNVLERSLGGLQGVQGFLESGKEIGATPRS